VLVAFKKRGTSLAPAQADSGEGHEKRPRPDQRTGLIWLCRKERVLAIGVEIVKRASAYFVRENPIVAHRHHAVAG
jgi:hypothetical protein